MPDLLPSPNQLVANIIQLGLFGFDTTTVRFVSGAQSIKLMSMFIFMDSSLSLNCKVLRLIFSIWSLPSLMCRNWRGLTFLKTWTVPETGQLMVSRSIMFALPMPICWRNGDEPKLPPELTSL